MKKRMDDGEVEISEHFKLPDRDSSVNLQNFSSVDSILDELLKNTTTCTHTHTCNPPGPDAVHTHTCHHTHTQVIPSGEDNSSENKDWSCLKPRRPTGNREAVRKYREKKKAHTAHLEEELKKLQSINQQLVRKLQGKATLEAEVLRLRTLLVDIRAKIHGELGVFPFKSQCNSSSTLREGDSGFQSLGDATALLCQTGDLPCFHLQTGSMSNIDGSGSSMMVSWTGNGQPTITNCQMNGSGMASAEGHAMDNTENMVTSGISSWMIRQGSIHI